MWDLIVSVPDHCLSFYFEVRIFLVRSCFFSGIYNVKQVLQVPVLSDPKMLKSHFIFIFFLVLIVLDLLLENL